ncbi:MAG: universal stress protein [Flavobacteriales bacterium]|nr:universal stress protein [Flavobacteriales bacterium]MDG1934745.1 universal stress protein [Flavobacteriales bacterium]MDG2086196.1 universal stress protein [Flavobacteriales bacterium]
MSANKILVPIGFSEQSILALGQAFNLAKIKNSDVVLLSVVKEQSMMQSLFVDDLTDQLKLKVKQKLNELAKQYGDKFGVSVDTMVSKGKIYEQINEVAELISADLIVMGTNGSQGNKSKLIGSNAEKVVRLSKCPVITIKGKDNRIGCENIILPLDLERQTKEKVTYALEYARYWNATIRVVSVVLRDNQEVREKLKKNINQVHDFIVKAGVKCSAELIEGGKKITLGNFVFQYEKKFDADLIMIMTKQEELSLSNNISDTARYIINNSEIPVMSIRPKESKHLTGPTIAF